jgi:hypothetical protein
MEQYSAQEKWNNSMKHVGLYLCMLFATEVILKIVNFFYCLSLDLGHFLVLII